MIDFRRSQVQAQERDQHWSEASDRGADSVDPAPPADRVLAARQRAELVRARLSQLPERARAILLRHRVDGISQREIAQEFGVSQSTVESDLRAAYRWLEALRHEMDEEKPR
jgi:RNA polymerase sigma-70 factor (ECF subfamily)